jgi:hypothetical protein
VVRGKLKSIALVSPAHLEHWSDRECHMTDAPMDKLNERGRRLLGRGVREQETTLVQQTTLMDKLNECGRRHHQQREVRPLLRLLPSSINNISDSG